MSAAATLGLGANRWNPLQDTLVSWFFDELQMLVNAFMADGHPPFTEQLDPYHEFLQLQAMATQVGGAVNLPLPALERLQELSLQYGQPQSPLGGAGMITGQPLGPQMPLNLRGLARAAFSAQQDQQGG